MITAVGVGGDRVTTKVDARERIAQYTAEGHTTFTAADVWLSGGMMRALRNRGHVLRVGKSRYGRVGIYRVVSA